MKSDVYTPNSDFEEVEVVTGERVYLAEADIRVLVVEFDDGSRASIMCDVADGGSADWSVAASETEATVSRTAAAPCLARDFADRRESISSFLQSAHEVEGQPEQSA